MLNTYHRNFDSLFLFVISIICLGCYYPCYYNQFLISENFYGPIKAFGIAIFWLFYLICFKKNPFRLPNKYFSYGFIIIVIYLLLRTIIHDENSSFAYIRAVSFSYLLIFLCINTFVPNDYMKMLVNIMIVMFLSTLLGLILFLTVGLNLYGTSVLSSDEGINILNYGFFFVKFGDTWSSDFIRPSGWFDEPGSFANVVLLFLIYNRVKIRSKKLELILLLGGCLSLSLACFIISFVYVIFFLLKIKYIKYVVVIFLALVTLYFNKPSGGFGEYVWDKTFGRVEDMARNEDTSRNYDEAFKVFQEYFLTGESNEVIKQKYPEATKETIWFMLGNQGVVGVFFYYIFIVFILIKLKKEKKMKKEYLLLLFLFAMNLAQRPVYLFPLYLLLIYYTWFDNSEKYFVESV